MAKDINGRDLPPCITDLRHERGKDYGGEPYFVRVKLPDGDALRGTCLTITDAKELVEKFKQQRREGTWQTRDAAEASRGTYQEWAETWRTTRIHRDSTASGVAGDLRRYVYDEIGRLRMTGIRRSHIQKLVATMNEKLAPATVERVYSYVATSFRDAVLDGVIAKTPCVKIQLPKVQTRRIAILEEEIVSTLVRQMRPEWRAAARVALGSGLRPGELFGLTADRINFKNALIVVNRQVLTPTKGVPYLGPPKTDASNREIPVPHSLLEVIEEQIDTYSVTAEVPVGEPPRDGQKDTRKLVEVVLLFPYDGGLARRQRQAEAWHRAGSGLLLPERSGWHDFRHYYASMLIEGGENVKVVQARLGHKSALETLDTYGHLWPKNEDVTRGVVDLGLAPFLRED